MAQEPLLTPEEVRAYFAQVRDAMAVLRRSHEPVDTARIRFTDDASREAFVGDGPRRAP